MTKTELKKMIDGMLNDQADKEALFTTLSQIITMFCDRDYLKGGSITKEYKHGRLEIRVDLRKAK